jgi:copper chaperone
MRFGTEVCIVKVPTMGRSSGLRSSPNRHVVLRTALTFPQWQAAEFVLSQLSLLEKPMIAFQVNDMTCGHCVSAVTRAVKGADPAATVQINLGEKRVQVESATASADELAEAIADAGYTPVPLPAAA